MTLCDIDLLVDNFNKDADGHLHAPMTMRRSPRLRSQAGSSASATTTSYASLGSWGQVVRRGLPPRTDR